MKIPEKLKPQELCAAIEQWLASECDHMENGQYLHKPCGSAVLAHDVLFSIHFDTFPGTCGGAGEVRRFTIPFCEKCEAPPAISSCVHIPSPWRATLEKVGHA